MGCHIKNAPPKQALKVAWGSVIPISVPATFAVYPLMKWYIACAVVRRETGGRTPNASQHSMMMFFGCGPTHGMQAFCMCSTGYEARVFSVMDTSS